MACAERNREIRKSRLQNAEVVVGYESGYKTESEERAPKVSKKGDGGSRSQTTGETAEAAAAAMVVGSCCAEVRAALDPGALRLIPNQIYLQL